MLKQAFQRFVPRDNALRTLLILLAVAAASVAAVPARAASPSLAEMAGQADELRRALEDLEGRSRSFGSALSGALRSAVSGGRGLDDVLRSLGNRLADIALSAGMKPLEGLIGGAMSGITGGIGKVLPFADGGVVSAPSYFPMGGNIGLMGEAGPEAIMPLTRGPDGKLGVRAAGGGGAVTVVMNISTPDVAGFQRSQSQIAAQAMRALSRGQRNR